MTPNISHHNHRALLWYSGGSKRPENKPAACFQRRTGRQAPELGAEPTNKHCAPGFTSALLATIHNHE